MPALIDTGSGSSHKYISSHFLGSELWHRVLYPPRLSSHRRLSPHLNFMFNFVSLWETLESCPCVSSRDSLSHCGFLLKPTLGLLWFNLPCFFLCRDTGIFTTLSSPCAVTLRGLSCTYRDVPFAKRCTTDVTEQFLCFPSHCH